MATPYDYLSPYPDVQRHFRSKGISDIGRIVELLEGNPMMASSLGAGPLLDDAPSLMAVEAAMANVQGPRFDAPPAGPAEPESFVPHGPLRRPPSRDEEYEALIDRVRMNQEIKEQTGADPDPVEFYYGPEGTNIGSDVFRRAKPPTLGPKEVARRPELRALRDDAIALMERVNRPDGSIVERSLDPYSGNQEFREILPALGPSQEEQLRMEAETSLREAAIRAMGQNADNTDAMREIAQATQLMIEGGPEQVRIDTLTPEQARDIIKNRANMGAALNNTMERMGEEAFWTAISRIAQR